MLKVTTQVVVDELQKRDVPTQIITEAPHALIRYQHHGVWSLLHSTLPEHSSAVGKVICDQKMVATSLAETLGIPVPATVAYTTSEAAREFLKSQKDVVVKPVDAAHGNGITVGVKPMATLDNAIKLAQQASSNNGVLLQQRVAGSDLRLLVIGGKFAAAARRNPATVVGDGKHTLRQLIDLENTTNPERGENDEKRFAVIDTAAAERFLGASLDTIVLPNGEPMIVVGTANIGAGGRSVDYTDVVPASMIAHAESFAATVKIAAVGVDFIWDETTGEYYFIEGNACPGFLLHINPSEGTPRPVHELFVDFLLNTAPPKWHKM